MSLSNNYEIKNKFENRERVIQQNNTMGQTIEIIAYILVDIGM
jgi:hypothetical protein